MPTERIGDYVTIPSYTICKHPDHSPPKHSTWDKGSYKHTCPECRHVTYFHINRPLYLEETNV